MSTAFVGNSSNRAKVAGISRLESNNPSKSVRNLRQESINRGQVPEISRYESPNLRKGVRNLRLESTNPSMVEVVDSRLCCWERDPSPGCRSLWRSDTSLMVAMTLLKSVP